MTFMNKLSSPNNLKNRDMRRTPPRWNNKQASHRWSKKKKTDEPMLRPPSDRNPEEWATTRRDMLWKQTPVEIREQLQLDSVSLYSVTEDSIADRMSSVLATWLGPDAHITDATACVGGNTISFARRFAHVNAVELTHTRCDMLKHNADILDVGHKITVYEGDYIDLWSSLKQDAVFLDPPWGGPDYKRARKLDLYLGSINIATLAFTLLSWRSHGGEIPKRPAAKLVALKLPYNYNFEALENAARDIGLNPSECIYTMNMGKIVFAIVCLPSMVKPHLPPGIMEPLTP